MQKVQSSNPRPMTIEAGTWLNGTWLNGTWLNGTWLNGTWLNTMVPVKAKSNRTENSEVKMRTKRAISQRVKAGSEISITVH